MKRFCSSVLILLAFLVILHLPVLVHSECTCDKSKAAEEAGTNRREALKYKVIAIASILAAGAIGVSLPVLGKFIPSLSPECDVFFLIKAFAAGVILSTGMVHILPDATGNLTNPCLSENPWGFPFSGLVAMLAAIGTLMVDSFASAYYQRSHFRKTSAKGVANDDRGNGGTTKDTRRDEHHDDGHVHLHTHATHGHAHGSTLSSNDEETIVSSSELMRHRVVSQVILHSGSFLLFSAIKSQRQSGYNLIGKLYITKCILVQRFNSILNPYGWILPSLGIKIGCVLRFFREKTIKSKLHMI